MNSSDSFTNLEYRIYDFFNKKLLWFIFQLANWEKKLLWTDKKFFFNGSNWEKIVEKFVKQIGENIWWIRYRSQHAPSPVMALHWMKRITKLWIFAVSNVLHTPIFFDKVPVLLSDSVKNDWSWLPFTGLLTTILNSENMYPFKKIF